MGAGEIAIRHARPYLRLTSMATVAATQETFIQRNIWITTLSIDSTAKTNDTKPLAAQRRTVSKTIGQTGHGAEVEAEVSL